MNSGNSNSGNAGATSTNTSSSSGGFRGFASKLREQAKDAVTVAGNVNVNLNNYRLPSFDDMAKNDEYIHSPDFRVRGGGTKSSAETATATATAADDAASHYSRSTESSWSLLDRAGSNSGSDRNSNSNSNSNADETGMNRKTTQQRSVSVSKQNQNQNQSDLNNNKNNKHKSSSVSLLSVVSDALLEHQRATAATTTTTQQHKYDTRNTSSSSSSSNSIDSDNSSDSNNDSDSDNSSEGFDEEDPILLSMARNKNNKNKTERNERVRNKSNRNYNNRGHDDDDDDHAPTSVITIHSNSSNNNRNKSSNRFMEDVRLQTPLHQQDQSATRSAIEIEMGGAANSTESSTTTTTGNSGPFGGYFKNMAVENLNRLKRGLNINNATNNDTTTTQQQLSLPPLARARNFWTKPQPHIEDENNNFETTTSAGILGEDDLQRLQQLRLGGASGGGWSSKIAMVFGAEFWHEHRHFLFVAFTLGLSIFVYFFTRNNFEDDVT